MSYRAWICEGCKGHQPSERMIWDCAGCGKEVCESCFWIYAHCRPCCVGQSDEAIRLAANAKGFEFEAPERQP